MYAPCVRDVTLAVTSTDHPAGTRKEILEVETPEEIADELAQIFKEAD